MKLFRRVMSAVVVLALPAVLYLSATGGSDGVLGRIGIGRGKETIRIWYSDDAITDYLNIRAVAYNEAHDDVRIEPTLVSGVEFLENVNRASLESENFPDLYLTTHDTLEKAQLAGLTTQIPEENRFLTAENFPETALNAVTYHGNYVAYPFYYETSVLMYNRTYLEDFARGSLTQERMDAGAESAVVTDEEVNARIVEIVPETIAELLRFANSYNAPANVESVFKWDVTDIFYNYFFIGDYMNAGGPAGDDLALLDLYNTEMISCMKAYQKLNEYFAIDAEEVSYDQIIEDFIAGKMVFTVVTSDAERRIREAQDSGSCTYTYVAAPVPGLNEYYGTRTMSVTECIAINGYSEHPEEAAEFAEYLISNTDETIFRQAGKLPARKNVAYEMPNLNTFFAVYERSVPMPKMIETSNLWMRLEIAFTQIWNGANCNQTLKELSESVMTQVVKQRYEEMLLPEPEMVSITDEAEDTGD
ncbi:MAG: extracellular solute-binding protein [Lachnospiraceae bacterium]|nr:extracellular solute-binding protein [Lachnospiraceae bacterium]